MKNPEWHDHFAWWPVDTGDATCWLVTVQRRWNPNCNEVADGHFGVYLGGWEYRQIQGGSNAQ